MRLTKSLLTDIAICLSFCVCAAFWVRDRMPASQQDVAKVEAIADSNASARELVALRLARDPDINIGDARRLLEQVIAMKSIPLEMTSLSIRDRELAVERDRLSTKRFWDLGIGDMARKLLLCVAPFASLVVGVLLSLSAFLFVRTRRRRLSQSRTLS